MSHGHITVTENNRGPLKKRNLRVSAHFVYPAKCEENLPRYHVMSENKVSCKTESW